MHLCWRTAPEGSPYKTARHQSGRLFRGGEGVEEVVRVFAIGDDDVHCAGEASELAGTGVGHDDDVELGGAPSHGGIVLQNKRTSAALKTAGDAFDGPRSRRNP